MWNIESQGTLLNRDEGMGKWDTFEYIRVKGFRKVENMGPSLSKNIYENHDDLP